MNRNAEHCRRQHVLLSPADAGTGTKRHYNKNVWIIIRTNDIYKLKQCKIISAPIDSLATALDWQQLVCVVWILLQPSFLEILLLCLGVSLCLGPTPSGHVHGLSSTLPFSLLLFFLGSFLSLTTVLAPSLEAPAAAASEFWRGRKPIDSENFVQLSESLKSQGVLMRKKNRKCQLWKSHYLYAGHISMPNKITEAYQAH